MPVDTIPSAMNEAGDKMVTNDTGTPIKRRRKGGRRGGPCAKVKFGSASVPIYLSESKERTRYFLCYHRDGQRLRHPTQNPELGILAPNPGFV